MKYCLKCGLIYAESYDEYENDTCWVCGFTLIEDESTTEEDFLQLSESEKDNYELKIYNICRQSEFFDEAKYQKGRKDIAWYYSSYRFDKFEQLTGKKAYTKENELYYDMKAREAVDKAMSEYAGRTGGSNRITCPFCKSTNISKISAVSRIVSTGLFGMASKKIGKQWHCKQCGSEW